MVRLRKALLSFRSVFDKDEGKDKEKKEKKKNKKGEGPGIGSSSTSLSTPAPAGHASGSGSSSSTTLPQHTTTRTGRDEVAVGRERRQLPTEPPEEEPPPPPSASVSRQSTAPPTYEEAQAGPTGNFILEKNEKDSPPSTPPGPPKKTPWQLAFERLKPSELRILGYDPSTSSESASLSSAVAALEAKLQEAQSNRWAFTLPSGKTVILRDTIESVLVKAQSYMKIGDVMIQHNPEITALIWGSIRFLMQAGINDLETFHSVIWNLEAVVAVCGRGRLYEGLHGEERSEGARRVMEVLPKLYEAVLRFLAKAVEYFTQTTTQRFIHGMFKPFALTFGPLLDNIRDLENKMDVEARVASEEAQAIERLQSMKRHKEVQRQLEQMETMMVQFASQVPSVKILESIEKFAAHQEDENRLAILKWLAQTPYLENHKATTKVRQKGTGGWLLEKETFRKWREEEESALLWMHGLPGTGKTVLSSYLIDTLSKEGPLAYFYCNYKQSLRQDASAILGTLVKQLCTRSPTLPPALTKLYNTHKTQGFASSSADVAELEAVLLAIVSELPSKSLTIIIDALDELPPDVRKELYPVLANLRECEDATIKIVVTSRWVADIKTQMSKGGFVIDIKAEDTTGDIKAYIDAELERVIEDEELLDGDVPDELLDEIREKLYAGAGGMFLWVRYQIPYICAQDTEYDLQEALLNLPSTLAETYTRILLTIRQQTSSRVRIAERVLRLMLVSTRPLTLSEVSEIAAIEAGDTSFDPKKAPRGLNPILGACGNLIVFDEALECLRFAHFSVQEFLARNLLEGGIEEANRIAAEVCLTVLCFSPSSSSASASSSQDTQARRTLRRGNLKDVEADLDGNESRNGKGGVLAIRSYAAGNWMVHFRQCGAKRIPEPDLEGAEDEEKEKIPLRMLWTLFEKFTAKDSGYFSSWLETAIILFPDLDYHRPLHQNPSARPNPLLICAHFSLSEAVSHLLTSPRCGYTLNAADPEAKNWTQLHIGAAMVSITAVETLLSLGADPVARDVQDRIPLHIISQSTLSLRGSMPFLHHPTALITTLLIPPSSPPDTNPLHTGINTRDSQNSTALHHAALARNLSSLRALLISGASTTAINILGRTPLQCAILEQPLFFPGNGAPDTIMHLLALGEPRDTCVGSWASVVQQLRSNAAYTKINAFLKDCGLDIDDRTFGSRPLGHIPLVPAPSAAAAAAPRPGFPGLSRPGFPTGRGMQPPGMPGRGAMQTQKVQVRGPAVVLWNSPSVLMWRGNVMGTRISFRGRCERWVRSGRDA